MRSTLSRRYEEARRAGLPAGAECFPALVRRYFGNVSGYEPAEFLRRLLPSTVGEVLVVGVGGGRDAYWLARAGFRVTSIDIAPQPDIPLLVLADMVALPFRAASFDAVVVADALEHTFSDREAVLEFHRVLRPEGVLLLNVPYGDDAGEHHVRVYTEATLRRLLESAGFRIDRQVYRGLMPLLEQNVPGFMALFHGANLVSHVLLRRTFYRAALERMCQFDWRRGDRPGLRRLSRVHGAYIRAIPVAQRRDFREVNRQQYEGQVLQIAASHLRRSAGTS